MPTSPHYIVTSQPSVFAVSLTCKIDDFEVISCRDVINLRFKWNEIVNVALRYVFYDGILTNCSRGDKSTHYNHGMLEIHIQKLCQPNKGIYIYMS